MVVRDKLKNIKMNKSKFVISYLTIFTQMTEKLFGVGEIVSERDIVSFSLLVFPKSWENFIEEKMISVSTLERKWYEVVFSRGKALMKHLKSRVVKQIGVSVKNLYRLKFEIEASLSSREISMHKCDLREIWHRGMGHLHHVT